MKTRTFLLIAAMVAGISAQVGRAATIIVNAADGPDAGTNPDADLVIRYGAGSTFDSQSVPPSGSANIYASTNGGTTLLNSGNTNASLAWSQTITNGLVITLIHEDFNIAGTPTIFGFDILGANGTTLVYNGDVDASNNNIAGVAGPSITAGSSLSFTDTDGTQWQMAFSNRFDLGFDKVGNIQSTPDGSGANDDAYTLTFTQLAPNIAVSGAGNPIADGDATPSLADLTDFGTTPVGAPVLHTFRVSNTGNAALSTSGLSLPVGYSIFEGLSASIAAGAFDDFTVRLDAVVAGTYSGDISFIHNDPSPASPYNFAITGEVIDLIPAPAALPAGLGLLTLTALRRRRRN